MADKMTLEEREILQAMKQREASLILVQIECAKKHPNLFRARYRCTESEVSQMVEVAEESLFVLDMTSNMPLLPLISKDIRGALAQGDIDPVLLDMVMDRG